ncbi:mycofactocin biosynthesis glycosyltransferase MftF [Nesterenkonia flava]|uniref:Mycofactocin biosynthesis glycosyltransferase MftF n=1 Tax=Nesterenkonia flava TaxID=469799 RepID=A0ABU1FPK2_9MICC|nr:mycofactocin biosynthesis glycosyltransferase MftF [Nesterenkonia flava]MDR5710539.1 mycofactocin biosynthesis glycosyltransferase MftF [Nesterenkonia flava]
MTLHAGTYVFEGGRVLMGGAPARVATLSPAAAGALRPAAAPQGEDRRGQRASTGRPRLAVTVTDATTRQLGGYLVRAGLGDPDPRTLPAADLSEVTVVIPCYRRLHQLHRLLRSITTALPDSAVVVVDDASGEQSEHIVALARDFGAEVITCDVNRGPAAARNTGLARVRTPYVLFVDTDVVVSEGCIDVLLRHFADPRLAAVAPRVLGLGPDADGRSGHRPASASRAPSTPHGGWVQRYENIRSSLDHGPEPSLVRPHSTQSWLSTTCLLARREALGGGFEDGMRVAEDVDLIWRLAASGWRIRYEPRVIVEHEHRTSMRSWLSRKHLYGTGAALLAQRHGDLVAPAVMSPWAAGVLMAVACQRRWSLPVAGLVTAVATAANMHRLKHAVPSLSSRARLAGQLTCFGLGAAVGQGLALAVRHWWPGLAAAGILSRRARRLLVVAAVAEAAWEYVRLKPEMDALRFAAARRLDDAAYGLGVWKGALRKRSLRALLPARPRARDSGVR